MTFSSQMTRRGFFGAVGAVAATPVAGRCAAVNAAQIAKDQRPNILFCIADDWGWPFSPLFGDPVIKTPTFERVAREGILLPQTYCASPSCTPSRGAILTGQMFYRLEEGANLWSTLPARFPVYPQILAEAGYHVGSTRKGWGPGDIKPGGRDVNPAGKQYEDFAAFLADAPAGRSFCFWFGSQDPHRPYEAGSGVKAGMDPSKVRLPAPWPDSPEVRSDVCDYFFEVERFDREVGGLLDMLEKSGQLDNTIVVMTSDNGAPFPRAKTNLYDIGTRMPTAVMWRARAKGGRRVEDFVSHTDWAPTFLEAAGLNPPDDMTGRSIVPIMTGAGEGRVEPLRDVVVTGRERHTNRSAGHVGYPMRAIRTHEYLYIRNFKPERWPAGDPEQFGDIDGGPTKTYLLEKRAQSAVAPLFALSCGKRPAEELYDCRTDPEQLKNLAADPAHAEARQRLADRLMAYLKETRDPRALGSGDAFDTYPYVSG